MTICIDKAFCRVLACSSDLVALPCLLNPVFSTAGQDSSARFQLLSCVRLDPKLTEISVSNFGNFSVLGKRSLKHMLLRRFHRLRLYRDKGTISNLESYSTEWWLQPLDKVTVLASTCQKEQGVQEVLQSPLMKALVNSIVHSLIAIES